MAWMVVVLFGSVSTGLAGIAYCRNSSDESGTVFIELRNLFNPWVAGIITAAILSAIMSTIDSQLLVSSSVISEDIYRVFIRPGHERAIGRESRSCHRDRDSGSDVDDRESRVLDLVSYAWAGFGAAFGPIIVFSLFWRAMTARAAIVGMLTGALTVVFWSNLQGGILICMKSCRASCLPRWRYWESALLNQSRMRRCLLSLMRLSACGRLIELRCAPF